MRPLLCIGIVAISEDSEQVSASDIDEERGAGLKARKLDKRSGGCVILETD